MRLFAFPKFFQAKKFPLDAAVIHLSNAGFRFDVRKVNFFDMGPWGHSYFVSRGDMPANIFTI